MSSVQKHYPAQRLDGYVRQLESGSAAISNPSQPPNAMISGSRAAAVRAIGLLLKGRTVAAKPGREGEQTIQSSNQDFNASVARGLKLLFPSAESVSEGDQDKTRADVISICEEAVTTSYLAEITKPSQADIGEALLALRFTLGGYQASSRGNGGVNALDADAHQVDVANALSILDKIIAGNDRKTQKSYRLGLALLKNYVDFAGASGQPQFTKITDAANDSKNDTRGILPCLRALRFSIEQDFLLASRWCRCPEFWSMCRNKGVPQVPPRIENALALIEHILLEKYSGGALPILSPSEAWSLLEAVETVCATSKNRPFLPSFDAAVTNIRGLVTLCETVPRMLDFATSSTSSSKGLCAIVEKRVLGDSPSNAIKTLSCIPMFSSSAQLLEALEVALSECRCSTIDGKLSTGPSEFHEFERAVLLIQHGIADANHVNATLPCRETIRGAVRDCVESTSRTVPEIKRACFDALQKLAQNLAEAARSSEAARFSSIGYLPTDSEESDETLEDDGVLQNLELVLTTFNYIITLLRASAESILWSLFPETGDAQDGFKRARGIFYSSCHHVDFFSILSEFEAYYAEEAVVVNDLFTKLSDGDSPILCDASSRPPPFELRDGKVKIRKMSNRRALAVSFLSETGQLVLGYEHDLG